MTDESSAAPGGLEELDETARTGIDTTVPHSARIWNYWLGGKDNYAVDRAAGEQYAEVFPGIVHVARTSRSFLTRAVRYLAGEAGGVPLPPPAPRPPPPPHPHSATPPAPPTTP